MIILAIETSCDESAVSLIEATGKLAKAKFTVLAHLVSSQIELHQKWGGVVPNLAKREHARNLLPLLLEALEEAGLLHRSRRREHLTIESAQIVRQLLEREPELLDQLLQVLPTIKPPAIDAIAVTQGPGLEPALWVGLNLAKTLAYLWQRPLIPINHLEGHFLSPLVHLEEGTKHPHWQFPVLSLLVSGGHTELILSPTWLKYQVIGQTRDDAAGEAFDKVARILGLPYPGGPEISRLAELASGHPPEKLPRPMITADNFDFSFSGLKTAVLYLVKKLEPLDQINRVEIAHEFQQAVIDVLLAKTVKAIDRYHPKTLVLGGGVVANRQLRERFARVLKEHYPAVTFLTPDLKLATDNATMIALAAYFRSKQASPKDLAAHGTLPLA